MLGVLEAARHAAFFIRTTLERNPLQIALQAVRPLVIGAHKLIGIALVVTAKLRATVCTAVFKYVDAAIFRTSDDHWRGTHIRALVVARVRDFRFQRHKVPGVAVENAFHLAVVDVVAGVDPVWNGVEHVLGPGAFLNGAVFGPDRLADHRLRLIHEDLL